MKDDILSWKGLVKVMLSINSIRIEVNAPVFYLGKNLNEAFDTWYFSQDDSSRYITIYCLFSLGWTAVGPVDKPC